MATIKVADKPTLDRVAESVDGLVKRTPFDLDLFMYWFGGLQSHNPGDEIENWMQRTMSAVDVPTATAFGSYALYDCKRLMSVSAPMATEVGAHAFENCVQLTTIRMPELVTIRDSGFAGCTNLLSVSLPKLNYCHGGFSRCTNLESAELPLLETIESSAFLDCFSLKRVTLPSAKSFGYNNLTSIETLILSGDTVPTIPGFSVFNTTCKVYVPLMMMEAYRTATNWAAFYSRGQICAMEDHPEVVGGDG